jgi:hypothetical protein
LKTAMTISTIIATRKAEGKTRMISESLSIGDRQRMMISEGVTTMIPTIVTARNAG